MKIRISLATAVFALTALSAFPASPKNMHGKFGFGLQRTLLGVEGINLNYWASPKLAVSFVLGTGFVLNADNDNTSTVHGSGGFKYVVYGTKFANLTVGVKADVAWASKMEALVEDSNTSAGDAAPADDEPAGGAGDETEDSYVNASNVTQWGVELPLEVEFFMSDSFSFNLAVGATFTMVPERPGDFPENLVLLKSSGLGGVERENHKGIDVGGALFGHMGFLFYF